MLATINFPRLSKTCINIFKNLHKTLLFERVNNRNNTTAVA